MTLPSRLNAGLSKVTARLIILTLLMPLGGLAQDSNSQPPKSPEVQRLEEEKARAALRKEIAEANKAELEARFPKPTSTPLAGTTTINDTAVIEGQMVAYVSMARAANRIVGAIRNRNLPMDTLAIYNERGRLTCC